MANPFRPCTSAARSASYASALALSVLLVAAGPAWADDPPPVAAPPGPPVAPGDAAPPPVDRSRMAEVLEDLPDLTVRAPTLTARPLFETTAPVNVITRERMDRELPRSFTDATRNQPGLWSTQGSAGQMGTPVIRGTQGNQVLLLLDGVRLSHSLFTIGPGQDWDVLDLEPIDRIEVVRTPNGAIYGTQGIGGATALYTRFPTEYACQGVVSGAHARLLYATGGENAWLGRLEGHVASTRVRAVAGFTYRDADDLVAGGDVGTMSPTAFGMRSGDVRLEAQVSPRDVIGLSFFATEKTWDDRFTNPNRDYDNWIEREVGILRWKRETCAAWADDVELRLAAVHHQRLYYRHDSFNRDQFEVWVPQADLIAHKQLNGGHLLTYGVHFHEDDITASVTSGAGKIKSIPDGRLLTGGAYVQDEWSPTRDWRVTAGVRFDLVHVRTSPDAATTDPLVDPDDIRVDRDDSAWTGQLSVFRRVNDELGLTANLARGYRFPGPPDLAQFRQAPDEIQVGNPDLRPEYSTCLDLGVHVRKPSWNASVVGYVNWLEDLIIGVPGTFDGSTWADRNGNLVQDSDEDYSLRTNAGSATFYGAEVEAQWRFRPDWTLFGNFTYWHGDIDPDATEPIGVPSNGTVGVRYDACRWWAEASCHMVARFDQIPAAFYDAEQFFWKDPQDEASGPLRDDHSMPGYATVDLRAGLTINDHFSVTAGVENLLDKAYRPFGSRHDAPGATFLLSVSIDF